MQANAGKCWQNARKCCLLEDQQKPAEIRSNFSTVNETTARLRSLKNIDEQNILYKLLIILRLHALKKCSKMIRYVCISATEKSLKRELPLVKIP